MSSPARVEIEIRTTTTMTTTTTDSAATTATNNDNTATTPTTVVSSADDFVVLDKDSPSHRPIDDRVLFKSAGPEITGESMSTATATTMPTMPTTTATTATATTATTTTESSSDAKSSDAKRKRVVRKKKKPSTTPAAAAGDSAGGISAVGGGAAANATTTTATKKKNAPKDASLNDFLEPRPARKTASASSALAGASDATAVDEKAVAVGGDANDDEESAAGGDDNDDDDETSDEDESSEPEYVETYRRLERAVRGTHPEASFEVWWKTLDKITAKDFDGADELQYVRQQALPRFVSAILQRDDFMILDLPMVLRFLRKSVPVMIEALDAPDNASTINVKNNCCVCSGRTVDRNFTQRNFTLYYNRPLHDCSTVQGHSTIRIDQPSTPKATSCVLLT
jgi:hypothetical protein